MDLDNNLIFHISINLTLDIILIKVIVEPLAVSWGEFNMNGLDKEKDA